MSAAFSTLSDDQKRRDYDVRPVVLSVSLHNQTDSDNVFNSTPSQSAQYANFNQVDPEDIFRMFFGMAICFPSS